MHNANRKKFLLLWFLGLIGVVAVLPYTFFLQAETLAEVAIPLPVLILASFIQSSVLLALVIYFGIKLSAKVGLQTPLIDKFISNQPQSDFKKFFKVGVISGAVVAFLILSLEILFKMFIPALETIESPPLWQGLLASFYGAFTEELIVRYFLMSLLVWILFKVFRSHSSYLIFTAIIGTALIFGLLHLPAMASMVDLTPLITARVIILNSLGGIVFGYLFWKYGLEYAILSHFIADILLQTISRII